MKNTRARNNGLISWLIAGTSILLSFPALAQNFIGQTDLYAPGAGVSVEDPVSGGGGSGIVAMADPPQREASAGAGQHPRVFMTPAELHNLVTRINSPESYSAKNFAKLSGQVKADLAANVDWDAAYSGCDL